MKKTILFFTLFTCINCFAISTVKLPLQRVIKLSEFVGVVHADNIEKVDGCGYLVTGKVIKAYKGKINSIKFWARSSIDVNNYTKKYFVIAYDRQKKGSDRSKKCVESNLYTGLGIQTLFPFDMVTTNYILANRESFLTTYDGQYYVFDELVKRFKIINGQIHAMASWANIEKELTLILKL